MFTEIYFNLMAFHLFCLFNNRSYSHKIKNALLYVLKPAIIIINNANSPRKIVSVVDANQMNVINQCSNAGRTPRFRRDI